MASHSGSNVIRGICRGLEGRLGFKFDLDLGTGVDLMGLGLWDLGLGSDFDVLPNEVGRSNENDSSVGGGGIVGAGVGVGSGFGSGS